MRNYKVTSTCGDSLLNITLVMVENSFLSPLFVMTNALNKPHSKGI